MSKDAHKYPQSTIRIDPDIMTKLKYVAKKSSRTTNKEIEHIIIKHIKEYEAEYGEITSERAARLFS